MNKKSSLAFLVIASALFVGCQKSDKAQEDHSAAPHAEAAGEKSIQHLNLPDVTSQEEAVEVLTSTTAQLKSKKKLDAAELGEIHIITYSLEKAVAYFVENSSGDRHAAATQMAEVVEEIHLNSENNRAEATRAALDEYFELEEAFRSSGN